MIGTRFLAQSTGAIAVLAIAAAACAGSSDETTGETAGSSAAGSAGGAGKAGGASGAAGQSAGAAGQSAGAAGQSAGAAGQSAGAGGQTAGAGGQTAGAAGASAGMGGQAGGASGAGGQSGLCPGAAPPASTPCSTEGLSCSYAGCCATQATCTGGVWVTKGAGCLPPTTCPKFAPQDGDPCDPCMNGTCSFDKCSSAMPSNATATCLPSGVWQVTPQGCATVKCGTTTCSGGAVCLGYKMGGPAQTSYGCALNPCYPDPVSCACAGDLFCKGLLCTEPGVDTILCTDKQAP